MKKKFLALVLTLAMVLSLVPVTALATDGTSDTTTKDVVYGHYEGNAWTEGAPTRTDGLKDTVTVNKTAEKVDGQNNQYEVTLTVQMKHKTEEVQPGAAATVLVIDKSGSMNDNNRLPAAKTAAINFLKSYSGFSDSEFKENGSLKNNVRDKKLKRYVSLVTFNDSASVKQNWIDVSTKNGYQKLVNAINGIKATEGTNLDAALRLAKEQMQSGSIAQIDQSKRNVIALTDGVPTYYVSIGTGWFGTDENVSQHGNYGCPDTNVATTRSADALKADGTAVYTVCFGAENDRCWTEGSTHTWKYLGTTPDEKHATDGPTVGYFLEKSIATQPANSSNKQYAYNADDADGLYQVFAAITQTITEGLNEGVVTDGLPAGVTDVEGSGFATTWTLDSSSVTPTTSNGYNVYTYTKTYRVNVDPATAKTVADNGVNYAPLNTPTILTVQHNGSPVQIPFPIPAGKVTENPPPPELDSTDVYVYFQTQNTEGNAVDISGTSIQYNEHSWATLGKISTTQTLTSGETYTGEDNAILNAVGEQAKTDLNGEALYLNNQDIAAKVLPSITWISLQERNGADGYQPAEVKCWHLDGKLTVYGVTYLPGVEAGMEVTNMPENTQTYYLKGTTYTVSSNVPQCTGYTFAGWKSSDDNTVYQTESNMQFTMPAKDVTLTAQWTPNNGTKYRVEHYQQQLDDTYKLKDTDTLSGETGASVIAQPKTTYTGFTCDKTVTGTVERGTIAADGSLVLKLYYTRNSYNVTYQYEGTAPDGAPDVNALSGTHKYEEEVIVDTTVSATAVAGYTFSDWSTDDVTVIDNTFTMPDKNVVFKGSWTPNTNTAYKVEHYQQQLDGTTYELKETDTLSGNTGDSVTAQPKTTYTGFTCDKTVTGTVESGMIAADGSLVLKLYYTRNSYNVTYQYEGTAPTGAPAVNTLSGTHKYGAEVIVDTTVSADAVAGYTFSGWRTDDVTVTDGKFTMPATNVTLKGKFEEKTNPLTYTIIQNFIDGKGNTIEAMKKETHKTIAAEDAAKVTDLNTMIPEDMQKDFTDSASNRYLYVRDETKFSTTTLLDGTKIDLYYYLDNWKDGDSKTSTEDDSATGGDGIPDCYQVLVNYKSGDTNRGSVGPLTMEVLTIKDATTNSPINKGKVTASGSTATATGSRCYFSNWTNDDNQQIANSATLEARTIDAKGGDVYTFTANFGRSSGGSNRPKPPVVEIPDDVPTGLNGKDHYAYVVGYPDGMVYPQKNITRAEVATIFFRLLKDETREANMTKSNGYNDMKDGAWYTCAVSTLSKMGIIKGYEDGSFKPDASISRAEFAAIAARFDPDGDKTPATFSDVSSHWAKDEISIAANHGWIKGYEDGSFKPDQKITRAETMTLVNRVLKRLPETKDDLHKDMKTWPDNQNESAWFYLAVQEATNSHYQKLKKDGTHETWESMRETRDWAALEK